MSVSKIHVVLGPVNLLPVAAWTDRQSAWDHARAIKGEVAPVELNPEVRRHHLPLPKRGE